ncbi:putative RING finger protein C2F3.16 [Morella rubra]|uniref:Putative RING finger protein C2F3.16 n=1 Tax=Morella rubra TaxID=262757 RepID=A0A6A1UYY5_9ROSI|nr:putative RING finger protein C2F3.16 [Morella rubra]
MAGGNVSENETGLSPSFRDPKKQVLGCEHYKRNCKLRAACCGKLYTCRFCHDKASDHSMDRKATAEMMCMHCMKIQPVGPICSNPSCGELLMAKYYCSICKFFDDERTVYHCPFCNLCRRGKGLGIDYFHCMTCKCCLSMKLVDHECQENCLETSCPICSELLFTSTASVRMLSCGHLLHSACFHEYVHGARCLNFFLFHSVRHTLAITTLAQVVANLWEIIICRTSKIIEKGINPSVIPVYNAVGMTRKMMKESCRKQ